MTKSNRRARHFILYLWHRDSFKAEALLIRGEKTIEYIETWLSFKNLKQNTEK